MSGAADWKLLQRPSFSVTGGASAIYTYIGLIPLLLWLGLKCAAPAPDVPLTCTCRWKSTANLPLLNALCLYGYSLSIFIPTAVCARLLFPPVTARQILCALPIGSAGRWTCVLLALCISGVLRTPLAPTDRMPQRACCSSTWPRCCRRSTATWSLLRSRWWPSATPASPLFG